ncbi:MAG: succinate dehydrogenase flavoprotein subunit [Planctomycetes bacterium]|nr:succinate dehydrogenase flavoprotein subunit [Planctomycetota bacterium]
MAQTHVAVVGGGLAGLSSAMKLVELGMNVDIFSMVPVKRSHSVCAQGGINGAVNTKGEGDHPDIHFYDTIKGGDFLAHQAFAKDMCFNAPAIIYLLDRMGVQFNRTNEGLLDFRRFGGTMHHRTAFAGATTGQQLLYALDEQVRRGEVEGRVTKYEFWEFLDVVLDDTGVCRGLVACNMHTMETRAFRADAVVIATGGPGLVFGRSTNSMINTGSAAAAVYRRGVKYANGEFIQIHPSAIPGDDKLRLMSESARGEGGRVWVKGDPSKTYHNIVTGKNYPAISKNVTLTREHVEDWENAPNDKDGRFYFLEDNFPKFLNLVPRDVGARWLHYVCFELGMGVGGKHEVYLDVRPDVVNAGPMMQGKTPLTHETLEQKLGGILEIYSKFVGEDPHEVPMRIFPAVHYSMGGLWVDFEATANDMLDRHSPRTHSTNIKGLYAIGECDYQYHGANRLGANSLLSCIFSGIASAEPIKTWVDHLPRTAAECDSKMYDEELAKYKARFDGFLGMNGPENPYKLHVELGDLMTKNVTVVRKNPDLEKTLGQIDELRERSKQINILDSGRRTNQALLFAHQLEGLFDLAKLITRGALMRDECRGSHHKDEFVIPQPPTFQPAEFKEWTHMREDKASDEQIKAKFPPDHLEYMKKFQEQNDKWLKTTIATYKNGDAEITYEDIDLSSIKPVPRKYD